MAEIEIAAAEAETVIAEDAAVIARSSSRALHRRSAPRVALRGPSVPRAP